MSNTTNVPMNIVPTGLAAQSGIIPESVDLKIIRLKGGKHPEFRMLPRDVIVPCPLNPRDEESFLDSDPEFEILHQSVHEHGFLPGFPLSVLDLGNGTFEILGGHRRYYASGLCGIDTLPCVVLPKGSITDSEKLRIVLDHRTTASLKDGEILNAFRRCVENGFTREMTCRTLGWIKAGKPNQNTYKKYMDVLTLPPEDQSVWKAYASHGKHATIRNTKGETIPLPYIPDTEATKTLVAAVKEAKDKQFSGLIQNSPQFIEAKKSIVAGKKDVTPSNSKDFDKWADSESERLPLKRLWMRLKGTYTRHEPSAFHAMLRWMHDLSFGPPDDRKPAPRPAFLDSPEWLADTLPAEEQASEEQASEEQASEEQASEEQASDEAAVEVAVADRSVKPRKVKARKSKAHA